MLAPRSRGVLAAILASLLVCVAFFVARPAAASYGWGARREALEDRIIAMTNQVRKQHGLQPVTPDFRLRACARQHSDEMLRLGYFSHYSPEPGYRTLSERVARAGSSDVEVGENLAYYDGYSLDAVAARVVNDWMHSPGHRANLLKGDYNAIGLGVSSSGGKTYVSQEFASERMALDPLSPERRGGQILYHLRGRLLSPGLEVGVFDGRRPLERIPVSGGAFDATVRLRAGSGRHSLRLGILASNTQYSSSFAIYNILPVDTN